MNKNNKRVIGKLGENIACEYLVKKGWKILARNYRQKADEIDIIAKSDDEVLVFCEVKALSLSGRKVGASNRLIPEDNLTKAKLHKISRACQFFSRKHAELVDVERGWRIDLLAIDIGSDGLAKDIRHYENV